MDDRSGFKPHDKLVWDLVMTGYDDDIRQQVGALSSVSFHWKLQECVGGALR